MADTPIIPPVSPETGSMQMAPPNSGTVLKKIIIAVVLLLLVGIIAAAVIYLPRLFASREAPVATEVSTNPPTEPASTVVSTMMGTPSQEASGPTATTTTNEPVATSTAPVETQALTVNFGDTVKMFVGDEINLNDSTRVFRVKAAEFTDSRCPAGVQCIWAGERGIRLEITNLLSGKIEDMRLGMITAKTADTMGLNGTLLEIEDEKGGPYAKIKFD